MAIRYLAGFVDNYGDNIWKRFVEGGLPTAILGIFTVFVVLSILWGFLEIFRYVFYTIPEKNKKSKVGNGEVATVEAPVSESEVEYTEPDNGELVAAIIAAVTAAREDDGIASSKGFRVVSFRKRK